MGDLDVGEMFLNFILDLKARIPAGIDLTHFIVFTKEVLNEEPEGCTPNTVAHILSKVNYILQLGFELGMHYTG
jgi:hypothetical protein